MFIDTHAHLLDGKFDKDRTEVIARALEQKVLKIVEIGCDKNDCEKTIEFAEKNENIYFTLGIHPQNSAETLPDDFLKLKDLAKHPKCIGIGETGLDYHYESSQKPAQKGAFVEHLKIARELAKPIILHCRDAYKDFVDILENDLKENGPVKGVVHCFSGSKAYALKLIQLGFFLGIDGPVTYPGSNDLRETVSAVPIENILLETDCPYLAPQERRGQRNEPAFLPFIANQIAKIKKIDIEAVEQMTTKNAVKLFGFNGEFTPGVKKTHRV